jgi:hypothetical protein
MQHRTEATRLDLGPRLFIDSLPKPFESAVAEVHIEQSHQALTLGKLRGTCGTRVKVMFQRGLHARLAGAGCQQIELVANIVAGQFTHVGHRTKLAPIVSRSAL